MNVLIIGYGDLGQSLETLYSKKYNVDIISRKSMSIGSIDKYIESNIKKDYYYVFYTIGTVGSLNLLVDYKNLESIIKSIEINALKLLLFINNNIEYLRNANIYAISSGVNLNPKEGWLEYTIGKNVLVSIVEQYAHETALQIKTLNPGAYKGSMQKTIHRYAETIPTARTYKEKYNTFPTVNQVANKIYDNIATYDSYPAGSNININDDYLYLEKYKTIIKEEEDTVSIDFDGVIHDTSKGFLNGELYKAPSQECISALKILKMKYNLILHSVRFRNDRPLIGGLTGKQQVKNYIVKYDIDYFSELTAIKPRAKYYIDDKALTFKSWDKILEVIQ